MPFHKTLAKYDSSLKLKALKPVKNDSKLSGQKNKIIEKAVYNPRIHINHSLIMLKILSTAQLILGFFTQRK